MGYLVAGFELAAVALGACGWMRLARSTSFIHLASHWWYPVAAWIVLALASGVSGNDLPISWYGIQLVILALALAGTVKFDGPGRALVRSSGVALVALSLGFTVTLDNFGTLYTLSPDSARRESRKGERAKARRLEKWLASADHAGRYAGSSGWVSPGLVPAIEREAHLSAERAAEACVAMRAEIGAEPHTWLTGLWAVTFESENARFSVSPQGDWVVDFEPSTLTPRSGNGEGKRNSP